MSAIPRPVSASLYLRHHTDLDFSPCSYHSSSLCTNPQTLLHNMASTVQTSSHISLPVSPQLLRPLSPVDRCMHGFKPEYSVSSSYNSTESLVSVLGHQSYDSDQCQSPKGEPWSPGNDGDSNGEKTYDYPPGYVKSPLAKSPSPLVMSPTKVETVDTGEIVFNSNWNTSRNRSGRELSGDEVNDEKNNLFTTDKKVKSSIVSQRQEPRDSNNRDETGNNNYYSYDNYIDNDNDFALTTNMSLPAVNHKSHRSKRNRPRDDFTSVRSEPANMEKENVMEEGLVELESRDPLQLTAWEQWMLRKAKQEREKRFAEMRRVARAKELVMMAKQEKEEKEKRTQEQLSQWCLKKRMDNDLKKLKKRQQELMAEQQRRQKLDAEQRAEENFRLWLAAKTRVTREAKQREKDRREKVEEKQRHRRKMSTAEFEKWCQKVENRCRQRHGSVSSCNSKSAPFTEPEPSFYNPIPWQPTVIPSPKADRKCRPCRSRYLSTTKCW